jgi:flap endonuclease-1
MGVQISEIIPRKEIQLSDLKGKILAIDAFNIIYQFLTTIRQLDGKPLVDKNNRITSHISGLFYRNINLLQQGIKLIYVFDGKPPELKLIEQERRKEIKEQAQEKYKQALEKHDIEEMRKYSQQFVSINQEIIQESKELLQAMGIPVIQAMGEGEAEASLLVRNNLADMVASQDYDVLLYGAPLLVRNLTLAKKRKTSTGKYIEVNPELIEFEKVLNSLQINKDQLICLGILVGTDYNPGGVKGIGQKRALDIVRQHQYPVKIFEYIEQSDKYELDFDWKKIYNHFKEFKCCTFLNKEIKFEKPDRDKIINILSKRDFSIERIQNGLDKLGLIQEQNKQKGLKEFF